MLIFAAYPLISIIATVALWGMIALCIITSRTKSNKKED